jgi:hypothetical protein
MLPDLSPGHYKQGADTNHFLGRCEECDAHYLIAMTQEQAERWYRQGVISQDEWEAFMYLWAVSSGRSSAWDSWKEPPQIPAVVRIVALMQDIIRRPAAREQGRGEAPCAEP